MKLEAAVSTAFAVVLLAACADSTSPGTGGAAEGGAGGTTGDGGGGAAACVDEAATIEPVEVDNAYGTLAGTLEVPAHCGSLPVILIVGADDGTGTDRDGNVPGAPAAQPDSYRMLAAALNEQGFATLRYDCEGIGQSAGATPANIEELRFDDIIGDAALWIEALRGDPRFSKVVAAGHSDGALAGILVMKTAPVDALISLEGAGRPAGRVLIDQLTGHLTEAQLAALTDAVGLLEQGELPGPLDPPLDGILPTFFQPYAASWFPWDPKVEIASVTVPVLIVQGATDKQVSQLDADLLSEGDPEAETAHIDSMCHTLKQAGLDSASQNAAYQDPSVPLAPGLIGPLAAFVNELSQH